MRTFSAIKIIILCLTVLLAVIPVGCFSAYEPSSSGNEILPAGMGAVRISIAGTGERTVFPDMSGFAFTATFTSGEKMLKTGVSAGESKIFPLEPGTWNINIEAAVGTGADRAVIGNAAIPNVTITAGQTEKYDDVKILPAVNGTDGALPDGTLSWSVDFPDGLDGATLFYGKAGVTPDEKDLKVTPEGTINLAPGSYLVRSVLNLSSLSAGDAEAVHIYSGQTTAIKWEYFEASFHDTIELEGSVAISHSDKVTIENVELNLAGLAPITLSEGSGNTYTFSLLIPDITTSVSGVLIVTTANNDISIDISKDIADPFELDPVSIFALEADAGTHGALKVNEAEGKTGEFQIDLAGGTTVTLQAVPDTGFTEYELLVGDVPYTVPFEISADTTVLVDYEEPAVDPNLIWKWEISDGWTNLPAGQIRTVNGKTVGAKTRPLAPHTTDSVFDGILMDTQANNSFIIIGSTPGLANTSNATYDPDGEFNFSRKVKITIEAAKLTTLSAELRIAVNNNSATGGNCVFGNIWQVISDAAFQEIGKIETFVYNFDPSISLIAAAVTAGVDKADVLQHSFVCLYLQSSNNQVLISSIKIEYND